MQDALQNVRDNKEEISYFFFFFTQSAKGFQRT